MDNSLFSIKAEHPDYPRLLAALEVAKGFCLFLAECNIPILREHIVDALAHDCGKPIVRVDLQPDLLSSERLKTIDAIIAAAACEAPSDGILSVSGLEAGLRGDDTQQTAHTLQEINFRRSALQRLGRPLIFWLPTYAMTLLARKAPDLHDWYSGIFIFEEETNIEIYPAHEITTHPDKLTLRQKYTHLEILTSLLNTAEKENNIQDISSILLEIARTQAHLGLLKKSLNTSLKLQSLAKISGTTEDIIAMNNLVASLYSLCNQEEKAVRYLYDENLPILFKKNDDIEIIKCLHHIARIFVSYNNLEAAKYIINEEVVPLITKTSNTGFDIDTKELTATIAEQEGDLDEALQIEKQIAQHFKDKPDQEAYAKTLLSISKLYCKKNEHNTAISIIENTVIPIYKKTKNQRALADITLYLANLLTEDQKIEEAYHLIKEAQEKEEAIGNRTGIMRCIIAMSNIEIKRGNIVKSTQLLEQAYQMISQTEDIITKSEIEFNYGKMLYLSGNKEKGLTILKRNANRYRQTGNEKKATEIDDAIYQLTAH